MASTTIARTNGTTAGCPLNPESRVEPGVTLWGSVIVPTCDRAMSLVECVRRLAPDTQAAVPGGYEVIVSDDGRTEETRRRVADEFPWVRWIQGPRRGPAANRNHGASVARGTWLFFTDDDCLPDPDWIAAFWSAIVQHPDAAAFEGAVLPAEPIRRSSARCPINASGGKFWSANIAVMRTIFERIGGFCPLFPRAAAEDQDLYFRLQQVTVIPFVPAARVTHPVLYPTLGQLLAKIRPSTHAHTLLRLRHPRRFGGRIVPVRLSADVMFHVRVVWRAMRPFDWRAIVVSGGYLTWGFACSLWYRVALRRRFAGSCRSRSRSGPPSTSASSGPCDEGRRASWLSST